MEVIEYFQYNSIIILSYFGISLLAWLLNILSKGKTNQLFFSCYRSSLLNPLTYIRLLGHAVGHSNYQHLINNFLYILLIGPMIEEKYGSMNLLYMFLITSLITGIIHMVLSKNILLGASGNVFMLIALSSFVNIQTEKIPLTLVLICIFYIIDEIRKTVAKKDHVSHFTHLIGAICGIIFGFLSTIQK